MLFISCIEGGKFFQKDKFLRSIMWGSFNHLKDDRVLGDILLGCDSAILKFGDWLTQYA